MSETITAKQFRDSIKNCKLTLPEYPATSAKELRKMLNERTGVQVINPKSDTKQLLRMMGDYFELDKKAVNFWIRQMELDKKI